MFLENSYFQRRNLNTKLVQIFFKYIATSTLLWVFCILLHVGKHTSNLNVHILEYYISCKYIRKRSLRSYKFISLRMLLILHSA